VNIINISGSKNLKNKCQGSGDGSRFLKLAQPDSTYIPSTNLIFIFDSLWIEYLYLYLYFIYKCFGIIILVSELFIIFL
jgi:hypothetical protein